MRRTRNPVYGFCRIEGSNPSLSAKSSFFCSNRKLFFNKKQTHMNHLDLGCGLTPKNPYGVDRVFGCDIRDISSELSLQGVVF